MPFSDITITIESSFSNCLRTCKLTFGCTHVSYVYTDKNRNKNQIGSCWLKNKPVNQMTAIREIGFTSAILNQGFKIFLNNILLKIVRLIFVFLRLRFPA